jgi:IS30 family transposase
VSIDKKKIIRLHQQGLSNAEIGRQVGCSRAYVSQTLKRERGWIGRVSPLNDADHAKLIEMAEKKRTTPSRLARNLILEGLSRE